MKQNEYNSSNSIALMLLCESLLYFEGSQVPCINFI